KKQGRPFVILDANVRIGGSWRTRTWTSLRLFTPARYDGLPGWAFPAPGWSYPTARETADYLEAYAARFELPVRTGMTVDRLGKEGERYGVDRGALLPAGALVRRLARPDGQDADRAEGPAACPLRGGAADQGEVGGSPRRRHRASAEDGRHTRRATSAGGRARHGRRERHLVHRLP